MKITLPAETKVITAVCKCGNEKTFDTFCLDIRIGEQINTTCEKCHMYKDHLVIKAKDIISKADREMLDYANSPNLQNLK